MNFRKSLSNTDTVNGMDYYVYVLKSKKDGRRYIGYTGYLELRMKQHKNGFVKSTRNRRPLELIYSETYQSKTEAERRERYLKGGRGHDFLKGKGL